MSPTYKKILKYFYFMTNSFPANNIYCSPNRVPFAYLTWIFNISYLPLSENLLTHTHTHTVFKPFARSLHFFLDIYNSRLSLFQKVKRLFFFKPTQISTHILTPKNYCLWNK